MIFAPVVSLAQAAQPIDQTPIRCFGASGFARGETAQSAPRLVDRQMHMFRHDHVASNCKEIAQTNALQRTFKKLHGRD
jgi:hypothetical protein